jgi:WD40 repeat protein
MNRQIFATALLASLMIGTACKPRIDRSNLSEDAGFLGSASDDPKFVDLLEGNGGFARSSARDALLPIVYVGYNGGKIGVWDTAKHAQVATIEVPEAGNLSSISVASQFQRRMIVVGDESGKVFWGVISDVNAGFKVDFYKAKETFTNEVSGVAVAQYGDFVAAGAKDGSLRFWSWKLAFNPNSGYASELLKPTDRRATLAINDVAVLADNSVLVSRDTGLERWNPSSRKEQPIAGFGGSGDGLKPLSRISSLAAMSGFSFNCQTAQALIAMGEDTGRVTFASIGISAGRWIPDKVGDDAFAASLNKLNNANNANAVTGVGNPTSEYMTVDKSTREVPSVNPCAGQKQERSPQYMTIEQLNQQSGKSFAWAIDQSNTKQIQGHSAPITSIHFSDDGRYVTTTSQDRAVAIWDLFQKRQLRKLVMADATSGNSTTIFSKDARDIYFTEAGGGRLLVWHHTMMDQPVQIEKSRGSSATISSDGKTLAYALDSKRLVIAKTYGSGGWTKGSEVIAESQVPKRIDFMAFAPEDKNNETLVTADCEGTVTYWKANGRALESGLVFSLNDLGGSTVAGASDIPNKFVGGCLAAEMTARTVVGFVGGTDWKSIVVSYPTISGPSAVVWDTREKRVLSIHNAPPDESLLKTSLRPSRLLVRNGKGQILEAVALTNGTTTAFKEAELLAALYPLQFSRAENTVFSEYASVAKSSFTTPGLVSAMAPVPNSDLIIYGGKDRAIHVGRLISSGSNSNFIATTFPKNYKDPGAQLPGYAFDVAASAEGPAIAVTELGAFLIWASEIHTHAGF